MDESGGSGDQDKGGGEGGVGGAWGDLGGVTPLPPVFGNASAQQTGDTLGDMGFKVKLPNCLLIADCRSIACWLDCRGYS